MESIGSAKNNMGLGNYLEPGFLRVKVLLGEMLKNPVPPDIRYPRLKPFGLGLDLLMLGFINVRRGDCSLDKDCVAIAFPATLREVLMEQLKAPSMKLVEARGGKIAELA